MARPVLKPTEASVSGAHLGLLRLLLKPEVALFFQIGTATRSQARLQWPMSDTAAFAALRAGNHLRFFACPLLLACLVFCSLAASCSPPSAEIRSRGDPLKKH